MQKKTIIAGGGVVLNENKELLMIFRRGKWDLPKGKLDTGETIEACALREVKEETGLVQLSLVNLVTITHHTYFDPWLKAEVVKETHWFLMHANSRQLLQPQTEEDITFIEWVSPVQLSNRLANSYDTIVEVVKLVNG